MRCTSCESENTSGAKFCSKCGEMLSRDCPNCGHTMTAADRFCNQCGTALTLPSIATIKPSETIAPIDYTPQHLAERILAEQSVLLAKGGGERKIVTTLFADMAGSTALIQDLDPEEVRNLIDPVLILMMEAVHHYEGYVAKSLGDGILALFGVPIAHEDHPQRALYAALRMQEAMHRYADRVRLEKQVPLQIRIGVHTGEVVVRSIRTEDLHTDYEPVGQSIHLASRMEGIASPGSIVVSEATYQLVEGYFKFKALGAIPIKGFSEPITAYEVLGSGPLRTRLQAAARRGLAPFVGRQYELEKLAGAMAKVRAGHGQIVGVVGEPGVGKSRLFYEFKPHLQQEYLVLETFSVSHGKAFAYLPLIELMNTYLQISPHDDDRRRREKVTGKVLNLERSLEDSLPYLFYLLGIAEPDSSLQSMDSQLRRQRTFETIKRLLMRESLNQPVVVIFEDLQWLDRVTEAFLDYMVDGVANARMLLLVNYRPEYQHDWGRRSYYIQLRLDPLGEAEAEELLSSLLGDDTTLAPLKHRIMTQTEGNPFFLEEVVQTLVEEHALTGEIGHYRLEQEPTALHIPATVQGVLSARIDRLPADEKDLLQTLSVIGKEFTWSLVGEVVDRPEEELRRLLSRLQTGEFLYECPAFPEVEFTFKHALTQEVAYGSLLSERRNGLHERTARAIEVLFSGHLEDRCSDLAHHYSCSGNIPKAVEYLKRSGEQAAYRCANVEAAGHLGAALKLLKKLPDTPQRVRQELDLLLIQGPVLMALKGYAASEVETTYSQALTLCRQVGTTPELFSVLDGLYAYYLVRREMKVASELAERLLEIAEDSEDLALLLEAHTLVGEVLFSSGELTQAKGHLDKVSDYYDHKQHHSLAFLFGQDSGVLSLSYSALTLALIGDSSGALNACDKALGLAQRLSHPASMAFALDSAGHLQQLLGEGPEAQARADAAINLSTEQGFSYWQARGIVLYGWSLAEQGQSKNGTEQIRQGIEAYRKTGALLDLTRFLGYLAYALIRSGSSGEAQRVLSEALGVVDETGERYYEAELYRLRGEGLVVSGAVESAKQHEAENCFRQAIKVAHRQGARALEWRAMLSLAQLYLQQGRGKNAQKLLTVICRATEDIKETSDIKKAKALLAQSSRPSH
ncbi:adenylate/guanylate cyclase domain-containing protein [Amphritea sp. HPY]|uniref:adenylate/guanylate cyclase domain-containing protein n=1 Tax=Amphritea sp. HPY TaxID=3421652 RepID=UPI003D7DF245